MGFTHDFPLKKAKHTILPGVKAFANALGRLTGLALRNPCNKYRQARLLLFGRPGGLRNLKFSRLRLFGIRNVLELFLSENSHDTQLN